jgi:hypothetical protein
MSINANRYLTLLFLFAAAAISYAVGFAVGFWVLIVVGAGFELAFWFQLILRSRRESRDR